VNFIGHIAVGRIVRGGSETAVLVGAALPDLASMARLHLGAVDGPLGHGVGLHHAADAVFHQQDWFVDTSRGMRDDLTRAGLPRGAALACAHVGVELLLDGELVRDRGTAGAVARVFADIRRPAAGVIAAAPPEASARWRAHLIAVGERLDPRWYADPVFVAERLERITAQRPRLAFAPHLVPTLAEHLARAQPQIADSAADVLRSVVARVAG
jgi:hypothetical protein